MKKQRRILSLTIALLLLFALAPQEGLVPVARAVTQNEIDSLKSDSKELANQAASLKSQLADLKNQRSSALKQKQLLDQQITLTVQTIQNTEKQISGYEALLAQTEYELEENRRQEEEQYAVFSERARVMEEAGTTSYWTVLFKADSFSDLLSRLSDVQEVMNYDQGILDGLRQLRAQIQAKQDEQEQLKAQSEEAKVELEAHKKDLDQQHAEAQALYDEIQANVAEYEEQLAEANAERNRLEAEIAKKSEELARQLTLTASKGGYIWPVTTSRRISSPWAAGTRASRALRPITRESISPAWVRTAAFWLLRPALSRPRLTPNLMATMWSSITGRAIRRCTPTCPAVPLKRGIR